jgi:DNA-binding NtrC family response regulator
LACLLISDDEADFRRSAAEALRAAGHHVLEAATVEEASALLQREAVDLLLTDLRMPGGSGIELLKLAADRLPDAVLVVITAHGSLDTAIDALRAGAHDYLLKPMRLEALVRKVELLVKHQGVQAENRFLRKALEADLPAHGLAGTSPATDRLRQIISRVAPTDATVLITGETGTGKEIVARAIHNAGPRREAPFVAINCGSIPETLLESELFGHARGAFTGAERDKRGLFEVAAAGTFFLDEIAEMPLSLQPKLLRALEGHEIRRVGSTAPIRITARIVAATHRDLGTMIEKNAFRSDLYYRLNVFDIRIPPLRERPQDIQPIALELLDRLCKRMNRPRVAPDPEAWRALEDYSWPGNVRELANVLERALILGDGVRLRAADFRGLTAGAARAVQDDLKLARTEFEHLHVRRVLDKFGGDKERAAEALGIDISSLYRKIQEPS